MIYAFIYLQDQLCDDFRGKYVENGRKLMGATNPKEAEEKTMKNFMEFQLIRTQFMSDSIDM